MKIILESTPEVGTIQVGDCPVPVPARVWVGTTESGIPVIAFITRIGFPEGADLTEYERELIEAPTRLVLEDPS